MYESSRDSSKVPQIFRIYSDVCTSVTGQVNRGGREIYSDDARLVPGFHPASPSLEGQSPRRVDRSCTLGEIHIPEGLATGCFLSCVMARDEEADTEGARGFRMIYRLPSKRAFERYQSDFAPALQADHSQRYGGGVSARRDVLSVTAYFDAADFS